MNFYSQLGQDQYVFEHFFRGKRNGVFVDVGAYDGERYSNTLFFERTLGWSGLCVEPLASAQARLRATRKVACEQVCVADFEGTADFVESITGVDGPMLSGLAGKFDPRHVARLKVQSPTTRTYPVPVQKLSTLLEKHGLYQIDYCSIDTEGSELSILSELDLERFRISVLTVENNYNDERLMALMAEKGYDLFSRLEQDCVFKRRDFKALPYTSVICAVWHGDPLRWERLRGHMANLARQTVPVQPIYVFDGGEAAPEWVTGRTVSVREALTIYQAWNVALSLVETPLVMNLNLDDRLAPDAVKFLEGELQRQKAMLAGGEWKVCYSQEQTDAVEACYPGDRLPYLEAWPPAPGTPTRLGSGTGERRSLGPATLWRMEVHLGVPHYPWRMAEGTLLKTAADMVWWRMVNTNLRHKAVQLPTVIGNYYSHPEDQAEFRMPPHEELRLVNSVGISLI